MIRWSKRGKLRRTQCVQYIAQESGDGIGLLFVFGIGDLPLFIPLKISGGYLIPTGADDME